MDYRLRPVSADEYEWLFELNKRSYHDVVVVQFGEWDEAFQRQMFTERWPSRQSAQIIEMEGERVGVIDYKELAQFNWLEEIQLQPKHQSRGIGSHLVASLIEEARATRRALRLQVLHQNQRARQLYERLGFVQIGHLENHYLMEIS